MTFRGIRKKPLAREATPGLCPPRQSLTLVSHRSVCDVDEAFSDGGSYTIFEVEGRFCGNLESRVKLVGVKPVFMMYSVERMHERRQVFLEVVALLDTCSVT